jgi:hypothetical protein
LVMSKVNLSFNKHTQYKIIMIVIIIIVVVTIAIAVLISYIATVIRSKSL